MIVACVYRMSIERKYKLACGYGKKKRGDKNIKYRRNSMKGEGRVRWMVNMI